MARKVENKVRGFEVVTGFSNITMPERKTEFSAGYDICSAEDVYLYPGEVSLIPTGIKAYMPPNEYLGIHVRSSVAVKKKLMMANSQGIIDSDYYNNEGNEGHIFIALFNANSVPVNIKQGERIAQGIFYNYLTVDDDNATGERTGGCGSTNKDGGK